MALSLSQLSEPCIEPVDGEIKHSRIVIKRPLRALTVVDVPVHYQDLLYTFRQCVSGAYGDVVEVAVAADLVEHGVVARRPQDAEAVLDLAGEDGVGELHGATRGELGEAVHVGMQVAAVPPEMC